MFETHYYKRHLEPSERLFSVLETTVYNVLSFNYLMIFNDIYSQTLLLSSEIISTKSVGAVLDELLRRGVAQEVFGLKLHRWLKEQVKK